MTDQTSVGKAADWLADNGGVLAPIVGRAAAKALTELVGGVAGIPGAWLSRIANDIKVDGEARSRIKLRIADAVGERAALDTEMLDRMADRWIGDELRKQARRERVAQLAAQDLESSPPQNDVDLEPDFLPRLAHYAEQASSEDMQALFARILAGEIRQPGTYSLSALHVLSIMDVHLASTVEKVSGWIIHDLIPFEGPLTKGTHLEAIGELEDLGLLRSGLIRTIQCPGLQTAFAFQNDKAGAPALLIKTSKEKVTISLATVTKLGRQIFGLVEPNHTAENIRLVAESLLAQPDVTEVLLTSTVVKPGGGVNVALPGAQFVPPLQMSDVQF